MLPLIKCNLIFLKFNSFGGINILFEFEYSMVFISERDFANNNSDEHYKQIKCNIIIYKS